MAKLDRFLQVLTTQDARELKLVSGAPPTFLFPDGSKPASQAKPNTEQLMILIGEIVRPDESAALRTTGRLSASIARPGLTAVSIEATLSGDRLEATLTPASATNFVSDNEVASPTEAKKPAGTPAATPRPPVAQQAARPQSPSRPAPSATGTTSKIDDLFREMVRQGASDLHLSSEEQPVLRVDGHLKRIDNMPVLSAEDARNLLIPITPASNLEEFEQTNDTDFAYEIPGLARFRCNLFVDRKGPGGVFRVIPSEIMTATDLGLPDQVLGLCRLTKGLVLVTGPTGSGKSTTLAAMVDHINKTRQDHVITIEDPIEFTHENQRCLLNQREISNHTSSFKRALRAALREDPDVVLIGELRDLETIAIAIETAETGHLVFGTLHTTTAVSTVDRIIDQFPAAQQAQIRTMLAESLKGVVSQTLCRKIGGGRVAALEILIGIPAVTKLVREGKTFQIPSIMQTGKKYGMVMLNEALMNLVKEKTIEPEEAHLKAVDKLGITQQLVTAGCDMSFLKDSEKEPAGATTS